ncbi:hypothetical protein H8959_000552 [Pygathrix nigripes]
MMQTLHCKSYPVDQRNKSEDYYYCPIAIQRAVTVRLAARRRRQQRRRQRQLQLQQQARAPGS